MTAGNHSEQSSPFHASAIPSGVLSSPFPTFASGAVELEPQLLRNTQSQIGRIVQELAELARSERSSDAFYSQFFPLAASAMLASAAAIWEFDSDTQQWQCLVSHQLPQELVQTPAAVPLLPSIPHGSVLEQVAQFGQPVAVPPADVPVVHGRAVNPIDQLLLFAPIGSDSARPLWLEVIQPPQGGPATQRGYLRFVVQLAELISEYLKADRLRTLERGHLLIETSQNLLSRLAIARSRTDQLRDVADTLCGLAEAEQVFILYRHHASSKKWQVGGVSGIEAVEARSIGMETIGKFANYCVSLPETEACIPPTVSPTTHAATSAPLGVQWFHVEGLNGIQQQPVIDFAKLFGSQSIAWVPLATSSQGASGLIALLLHWSTTEGKGGRIAPNDKRSCPSADSISQWSSLAKLGLAAISPAWFRRLQPSDGSLRLAWIHHRLPWLNRYMLTTLACLVLACIPVPLSIHATAILHPLQIQNLYAPSDAIIREIGVDHGEVVQAGQCVLRLEDRQLSASIDEALAQWSNDLERHREVENQLRRSTQLDASRRDQLEAEAKSLEASLQIQKERLERLQSQQRDLNMVSTTESTVGTWDVRRQLQGRPVRTGQLLMTLYRPQGDWFVEADIHERDIAILQQKGGERWKAKMFLTSHPTQLFEGQLLEMDQAGRKASPQSENCTYRVRFAVSSEQLPQRTEGALVRVQIPNGRSPLIWALSRDLILSLWTKARLWI